jgi:hypothetical protein
MIRLKNSTKKNKKDCTAEIHQDKQTIVKKITVDDFVMCKMYQSSIKCIKLQTCNTTPSLKDA